MAPIIDKPAAKYIVHPAWPLAGGIGALVGTYGLYTQGVDVLEWSWLAAYAALFAFGQVVAFGALAWVSGWWAGHEKGYEAACAVVDRHVDRLMDAAEDDDSVVLGEPAMLFEQRLHGDTPDATEGFRGTDKPKVIHANKKGGA